MRRIGLAVVLALSLGSALLAAQAQPTKVPRVGLLTLRSGSGPREEAFRQGLRDLGYVPGRDIAIEERYAAGGFDRLRELAAELVRLKVEIIVTSGPAATRSAKDATNSIPIVMAQDSDPVGNGFVASLARPDGNITGLSALYTEIVTRGPVAHTPGTDHEKKMAQMSTSPRRTVLSERSMVRGANCSPADDNCSSTEGN
jgi:putative ABC transport system substrate-binding protein